MHVVVTKEQIDNAALIRLAAKHARKIDRAIRVKQGKGQIVKVTYNERGRSVETPESEYLDGRTLLALVRERAS